MTTQTPTPEEVTAVDLAENTIFNFVTGPAGTGKTFMMKDWADNDRSVTLAATTGIAAVNLGGATTINALLQYFDTPSLKDAWTQGWLTTQLVRLGRDGLRRIVLDEVSMLDGEQLSVLVWAIEDTNDRLDGEALPPMGLTLTGDFCQLPPVKAKFAFEVEEWEKFKDHTHILKTIRRQEDLEFIGALQKVRLGAGRLGADWMEAKGVFKERTTDAWEGTTIFAKNDAVARFNQMRMAQLTTSGVNFEAMRWGKQRPEWDKQIPPRLDLKTSALVMILANKRHTDPMTGQKTREFDYVNGDLGVLEDVIAGTAWVKLHRTGKSQAVESIERKVEIPLEPGRLKQLKAQFPNDWSDHLSDDGKKEVIGGIIYMPLRLAYATTVHKSQGLTLDQVQINLRDPFFRQPGMLYVALSRARTVEGLALVGNHKTFMDRCSVDRRVKEWL